MTSHNGSAYKEEAARVFARMLGLEPVDDTGVQPKEQAWPRV